MNSGRYKWYVVLLLFSIGALNYGDRTAISAVLPLIRADLHMSDVELAAIGSLFLWSYALASPLAGYLADRLSRRRMIIWSLTAWSVVTALTGIASTSHELLFTRVLLGFAECAYLPAAIALIADHHHSATRGTAVGLHTAGLNFGMVVGGTVAGFLGEHFGWRLGFFLLGGIGVALAALAGLTLRDADAPASSPMLGAPDSPLSPSKSIATLVRIPTYLILVAEAMIVALGTWIFLNWLPLYFKEAFNMSLAGAGFSGTFMLQVAAVTGTALGGYISDRFAAEQPRRRLLLQAIFFVVSAPFLLLFLGKPPFAVVGSALFAFALSRGLGSANESPMVCDLLPVRLRSTALALMNTTNCLAGGLGVLLAGYFMSQYGLGSIFALVSVLMVVSAALLFLGYFRFARRDLTARSRAALEILHELPEPRA